MEPLKLREYTSLTLNSGAPPARSTDFRAELGAPRATREDLLNGPPIQPAAEQIQIQLISQPQVSEKTKTTPRVMPWNIAIPKWHATGPMGGKYLETRPAVWPAILPMGSA